MRKKEWVYREILYQVLEKRVHFFKQKNLAEICGVSIGNVNKSLDPLEKMNCIEKKPRGFHVIDPKKMLLYWASIRNLDKDIVYETRNNKPVDETEKELPPVIFTAYSGYKFLFKSIPADYSEVWVYGGGEAVEDRFKQAHGRPNIFVLKMDEHLKKFREIPLAQLFVDLWNINTWYANDFLKKLETEIDRRIQKGG
jgi:hypothetical protein